MLKIVLIYSLFPFCLFSNEFIWNKTEIGNNLVNIGKTQLSSSDSVGNVLFYNKELSTLFFKSSNDSLWQIRHKNEINTEISDILSVFLFVDKVYLLVLYNDLSQSLISSEINKNILSDE